MRAFLVVAAAPLLFVLACAGPSARTTSTSSHALPPAEDSALAVLDHSPRHGEMVDVALPTGEKLRTWIVYPERKEKAGVVVIIHEIFGLSDWIRGVADALAAEGFIAVAPDLLSGLGPNGGGTESFPNRDAVVQKVRELTPDQAHARIEAARAWAVALPAANGKAATMGFCWGGGRSFEAAAMPGLAGAVVFYGTSPDSATLERVQVPVLGHYGGDDARVDATIPPARTALERRGIPYTPHVYEGAGHGFLRAQNDRDGANRRATEAAWPRTITFLRERLE